MGGRERGLDPSKQERNCTFLRIRKIMIKTKRHGKKTSSPSGREKKKGGLAGLEKNHFQIAEGKKPRRFSSMRGARLDVA